jgi:hypothetical protein
MSSASHARFGPQSIDDISRRLAAAMPQQGPETSVSQVSETQPSEAVVSLSPVVLGAAVLLALTQTGIAQSGSVNPADMRLVLAAIAAAGLYTMARIAAPGAAKGRAYVRSAP